MNLVGSLRGHGALLLIQDSGEGSGETYRRLIGQRSAIFWRLWGGRALRGFLVEVA